MPSNFPNNLDTFTNPTSTSSTSSPSHAGQHTKLNDAVTAIQQKVGVNGSTDANSLDYKVSALEDQISNIGDLTTATDTLLGLEGNNNLTVSGIEMKTTIDSFDKAVYRTVRYVIQISKGSEHRAFQLDLIQDDSDLHIQEVEVSSNTENLLATISFEENNGIIDLCVTPVSTEVTARYYRTALQK